MTETANPTPETFTEDFLAHYGVKGMRWGKRKDDSIDLVNDVTGSRSAIKYNPKKASVRNVNGELEIGTNSKRELKRVQRQVDAVSSPDAARAKLMKDRVKSGKSTNTLTTKELQELVTRMNLEQQYSRLAPKTRSQKSKEFVANLLLGAGKQQATRVVNTTAAKQIDEFLN